MTDVTDDYAADITTTGNLALIDGSLSGSGNLETDGDRDWFAVHLDGNSVYRFGASWSVYGMPSPLQTVVYNANGVAVGGSQLVFGETPVQMGIFRPEASGTYYIEVSGQGTGGYTVGLQPTTGYPGPIAIRDGIVTEGDDGNKYARFSVTWGGGFYPMIVGVHYTTRDGTAVAGVDYQAVSGSLAFSYAGINDYGGNRLFFISVPILGDGIIEPNETFFIDLYDPSSYPFPSLPVLIRSTALGLIIDNDSADYMISNGDDDFVNINDSVFHSIQTGIGKDIIYGGHGGNFIDAGGDDDAIQFGGAGAVVRGGDGDDLIYNNGVGGAAI